MATHDYVIANGTGAAVRSDLNNALAAIVSNNSGSSEPGTTYAFQWWADTNANVLKIRNSSNDGWITLRELDGTMLMENGSVSAPGLAFASDLDTGFFRIDPNDLGIATGGVQRLRLSPTEAVFNENSVDYDFRVESNGQTHMLFVDGGNNRVGIGQVPTRELSLHSPDNNNALIHFTNDDTGETASDGVIVGLDGNEDMMVSNQESNKNIRIFNNGAERCRIDSSGRLLIGTSSSEAFNGIGGALQIEGTSNATTRMSLFRTQNDASASVLVFAKARNTSHAVLNSNDEIGKIEFYGADGNDTNQRAAMILCAVDGTPGGNDMPGRLVFFTTPDGSTTPTERMRIENSGDVLIGTTTNNAHVNADNLVIGSTSGSYQGLTINASTGSQIRFADAANNSVGYVIYNHGSNKLEFGCNGAEGFIVTQNRFIQTGGYTNNSAQYHRINGRNQTQGTNFCVFSGYQTSGGSSGDTAYFYAVNTGTGPNGAGTAFAVFRHALTSRSINAAGTINASGADYAEYMTKAGNFTLAKGDICGINSEGKLTNVFADAISFVVKSTDPSYVGGDTWHTAAGVKPGGAGDDRTEEEIAAATVVYEEALETARQLVDRIAFSGQVPVNVTGATPGQHIIPTAAADGSIEGTAKAEADLTMAEYMSSVGKVIAVGDDGRAKIIVKVA